MVTSQEEPLLFIAVEEPGYLTESEPIKAVIKSHRRGVVGAGRKYATASIRVTKKIPDAAKQDENETAEVPDPTAWTFLPVDPTTQPTGSARQDIRAHVARRQHRQRRQRDALLQRLNPENALSKPDGISRSSSSPSVLSSRCSSTSRNSQLHTPSNDEAAIERPEIEQTLLLNPHDPADQLHLYARQLGASVPTIWSCYLWQEREHGKLFHALNGRFKGWGPKYLHPLILTNQAILATTVLFTGCLLRHHDGLEVMSPEINRLRSKAYELVQNAINTTSSQLSDSTILAVLKLALFEAIFGQLESYKIHMQGLAGIIALRKGLAGLGMNGYLATLLMWFDANLSAVTMTERCLAGADDFEEARADTEVFSLGVERNSNYPDNVR